ncbi:MAG: serine/threonine protein kinase [Labilithrix sp.]|nr:serine/threonine protein kinase [Labilithrix sp.]
MVASVGSRPGRIPALTKYDVLEELGHGGMATVYRAHDKRLGRDVAIKVLHPHLRESSEIAHRFEAEAKAVAKLRHPNIVEVFDVSSADEDEQYLVVEFVRGQTLRKLLQKHGALPPEIAASLAVELLGALAHAHASGVVHRDVKPENVLLEHRPSTGATPPPPSVEGSITPAPSSKDAKSPASGSDAHRGERVSVKLTDFGIAKLLDAQGVTSTGQVLGSPAHMAPEQIEGGDVDGRADVFGLGVLLYESMVGHLPFEGNNPAQVLRRVLDGIYPSAERERPSIGKVYSQILDRALARKALDRFADAESMRDALSRELARLGIAKPRAELEAYFDDPEGWAAEHEKRLIAKLCDLGGEARKQGDAVSAASDYNRALAYAPDDPALLRIVSSMHRAEARMRLLRRVGPVVIGAVVLGTGAYFIASALKTQPVVDDTPASPTDAGGVTARADVSSAPVASTEPSAIVSAQRPFIPAIAIRVDAGATVTKKRNVTIASLRPANGVLVSKDGAPPVETSSDTTFTFDDKPHTLTFTCKRDLCDSRTIEVPAGDSDVALDVGLRIHPGKLIVEGDPTRAYGIDELPTTTVTPGVAVPIPMIADGSRLITVFDRADPSTKKTVTVRADDQTRVSFKAP